MTLTATRFETPLGTAVAASDASGALVELKLLGPRSRAEPAADAPTWDPDGHARLRGQLAEYFAGRRRVFELELAPRGTEFQREVWSALLSIPYGRTMTYGELAARLGRPGASRAVGLANGANPIWLVVPCHRVVGANGALTGYAGGIEVKRRLLELEGALPPELAFERTA